MIEAVSVDNRMHTSIAATLGFVETSYGGERQEDETSHVSSNRQTTKLKCSRQRLL